MSEILKREEMLSSINRNIQ